MKYLSNQSYVQQIVSFLPVIYRCQSVDARDVSTLPGYRMAFEVRRLHAGVCAYYSSIKTSSIAWTTCRRLGEHMSMPWKCCTGAWLSFKPLIRIRKANPDDKTNMNAHKHSNFCNLHLAASQQRLGIQSIRWYSPSSMASGATSPRGCLCRMTRRSRKL